MSRETNCTYILKTTQGSNNHKTLYISPYQQTRYVFNANWYFYLRYIYIWSFLSNKTFEEIMLLKIIYKVYRCIYIHKNFITVVVKLVPPPRFLTPPRKYFDFCSILENNGGGDEHLLFDVELLRTIISSSSISYCRLPSFWRISTWVCFISLPSKKSCVLQRICFLSLPSQISVLFTKSLFH